jgi:hypothetical protein
MTSLRQQLAIRRMDIVAHSAELRRQMGRDTAVLRQRIAVGRRLLALMPLLMPLLVRPLLSRLWRRARGKASAS